MNLSRARDNDPTLALLTYHDRIEASTLPDLKEWRATVGMLFHDAEDHCQHALATELSRRHGTLTTEIHSRLFANARAKVRRFAAMGAGS